MEPVAGFVLCGGASRRMGTDKALLPFHGRPLVAHVASRVAEATGTPPVLVGPVERFNTLGFEVVAEPEPGLGPLGGIDAVLGLRRADRNLVVACDMPAIEPAFLRQLLAEACDGAVDALIPRANGRLHPLCAVWRPSAAPVVASALADRQLRVHDVIKLLKINTFDANPVYLANANTPEDWLRWSA